jgi:hypothetical protein
MPPGADEAIKTAIATHDWQNVVITIFVLASMGVLLFFVKWWVSEASKKAEIVAKVAQDSIFSSSEREIRMAGRISALEKRIENMDEYVKKTLIDLIKQTITALKDSTDTNKQMKAAMIELTAATYGQSAVIRGAAKGAHDDSVERMRKENGGGDTEKER